MTVKFFDVHLFVASVSDDDAVPELADISSAVRFHVNLCHSPVPLKECQLVVIGPPIVEPILSHTSPETPAPADRTPGEPGTSG